ncbi:MAG: hypothetical protein KDK27_14060, partial [Leptospiraceae bacterium]|nr:hypothetical protein [Leptospiraceae bacterium]
MLLTAPLLADTDDWNDLDYDPGAIYGSEKEEKFRINAFIVEEENWDDHYSLSIFGAFRYTDYPLFTEWNIGYLYQNLQSKNDPRHRQYLFPFYYYKTDGNASFVLTPLAWFSDDSDGYRNSYAHLIYTGGNANEFSLLALPLLY